MSRTSLLPLTDAVPLPLVPQVPESGALVSPNSTDLTTHDDFVSALRAIETCTENLC
jgi:hypothetical protein